MEAELQPLRRQQRAVAAPRLTLWSRSSAFRKLAVIAGLVTASAISAPMLLTQPASCALLLSNLTPRLTVKAISIFRNEPGVTKAMAAIDTHFGAKLAPGYASMTWVNFVRPGQETPSGMAAVPDNLVVKAGDSIELNAFYLRAPDSPCSYIPWTVNRIVESADHG